MLLRSRTTHARHAAAVAAALAGLATATAATAPPAHATAPGRDGRIVGSYGLAAFCDRIGSFCLGYRARLATADADGANRRTLPLGLAGPLESPAVSADGTRLVAVGATDYDSSNDGKVRAGSLAGPLRSPVTFPGVADPRSVRDVSFTPAGGLVFIADSALYVQARRGGPMVRVLTPGPGESFGDPQMSPDGRTVAFTRVTQTDTSASRSVWLVGADGSGPRRLARSVDSPDWSPDGRLLVVVDGWTLVIIDAATGIVVRRGSGAADGHSPVWSPSGTRIAFVPYNSVVGYGTGWFATVGADLSHVRVVATRDRREGQMEHLAWQPLP